ncbi:terminase TerL endonuclease subunit [Clostridium sp. DMHC 10]|uniref:terminase large subunit n=1 Tax=Clostridium sp. DMHC 10 TaxID=747377 RepID=UPI00325AD996
MEISNLPILADLIEYANNCLEDKYINEFEYYISCKKHKWACKRFLSDLERIGTNDFPYVWDEEEAQKIVDWFGYLHHSKGVLAGKPIELNIWEKFFVCQIYGWRNKDTGLRRFTKSFVEVARKNAKSQLESGIALYELACGSTKNGEVYEINCAGVKRKQSKIVFDEAKLMLKGSQLALKFRVTRDSIIHIKTGSTMTPLSKEDGQSNDGGNIALMIIDEYHQHKTDEFYTMAVYGQNTKEPLLMIITTAGKDLNAPCYTQEYKYCSQILNPDMDSVVNDTYYTDILELDEGDKEEDIKNWYKANPIRMTYKDGQNKIKEAFRVAKEIPEKMNDFLTKCLNVWVQAKKNGYMDMKKWKLCEINKKGEATLTSIKEWSSIIPYDLKGKDVFVGVDMSAKIDLTSVAFIIPILDGEVKKYILFSHSFIPNREKLVERTKKDKVPYDAWERLGFLTVTNTDIVDQKYVEQYIFNVCKENDWNIHTVCVDPANASLFIIEMQEELGESKVVEVFQSCKSLNESTSGFREQVYSKNVLYTSNPLLNFAMGNAVIVKNNGLIKIDKDHTIQRIDPVDATLCAYKLAMYYDFTSAYDPLKALEAMDW